MTEGTPAPIPATSFRRIGSMALNMSSRTSRSVPRLRTAAPRTAVRRPTPTRPGLAAAARAPEPANHGGPERPADDAGTEDPGERAVVARDGVQGQREDNRPH